ncbi:TetR/AcrR family transcriptional regulator [Reinekea sp.]|uniref:TetR/AcrR family transcriptional regulator n=1 Tax=Reinekea sp. TaxID=1970455 RepID=UPI00398A292E
MNSAQKQLNSVFRSQKKAGRIRQQNEAKILKAAEVEFALNGYKGTSLNAVADRADLPKSNILYYFKSKLGLYGVVLADILELWNHVFSEASVSDDPKEVLSGYIDEKMKYSQTNPLASKIFAIEIIQGAPYLEQYLAVDLHAWVDDRADVFRGWISAGKINDIDPYHLIFMLWGSTQHYADFATQIKWVLGREELQDEDFAKATKTIKTIILGGLGLDPN